MKKFLVLVCMVALVVVASAAYASDTAWLISIKAVTSTAAGGSAATVGVGTSSEQTASFPASNGGATAERTGTDTAYHMRHDVARDVAAEEAGAAGYAWDLKIGARGTVGATTAINICIWNNTLPNFGVGGELNHSLVYGLFRGTELLKWFSDDLAALKNDAMLAPGFTADKWVNTSQLLKAATNWSPTATNMGFFITHTANNGAGYADLESYSFKAFSPAGPPPVTPEPGSLMALGSGLIGLAGFAIRRRK